MDFGDMKSVMVLVGILALVVVAAGCEDECPDRDSSYSWCDDNAVMYCEYNVFPFDQPNEVRMKDDCDRYENEQESICVEVDDERADCVEVRELEE